MKKIVNISLDVVFLLVLQMREEKYARILGKQ